MLKQVFGGLSNAANHILNQVSAEVSKMPTDRGQSHYAPVDPLSGLSDEERRHIQLVQKRAEEEAQMFTQFQKSRAPQVPRENLSPVLPPKLLEAESNEDEGELSSEVSTVKLVDTAGGEVSEGEEDNLSSDSSSETGGADEASDEPYSSDAYEPDKRTEAALQADSVEKRGLQGFDLPKEPQLNEDDQKKEILEAAPKIEEATMSSGYASLAPVTEDQTHEAYVEESDVANVTAQETAEAPSKVYLEKQPTIVVHSPSSSSRESYDDDSLGDIEAHFLPEFDELERAAADVKKSTEEDESSLVTTSPSVPLKPQLNEVISNELKTKPFEGRVSRQRAESFCESQAREGVLKELCDSRRKSLPAWCALAYEEGESTEPVDEDESGAFSAFDYDESGIPSTYADGTDANGQQPSEATIRDEVEQDDRDAIRLSGKDQIIDSNRPCAEDETSHDPREKTASNSLVIYEPKPFSNYLIANRDEIIPAASTESVGSTDDDLVHAPTAEEPVRETVEPALTYSEESGSTEVAKPVEAPRSEEVPADLTSSNISSRLNPRAEAGFSSEALVKDSAVHKAEPQQYPTATPRSGGGSSFKVSFGSLFSKTKSDLTSLASTVRSHTEAALKRASDTVASSLSTSASVTADLYAGSKEPVELPRRPASAMATVSDHMVDEDHWLVANSQKQERSHVDNVQESKVESVDFGGTKKKLESRSRTVLPASLTQSTGTSYGSDSTEDTGYSSRCSPEDEFYRIGSDGMQYFVTYSTAHTATIDQIKAKQEGAAEKQFGEKFIGEKVVHLEPVLPRAQQIDKDLSQSAEKPAGEVPSDLVGIEPATLVPAGQVACDDSLLTADQPCPHAQMYDSSEVSSEMYDEEEQNRIKEIESEFIFDPDKIDATPVSEWQICPLCQMSEIHMRSDGVSLTGQQCASCGFTVCFKCGQVHEIKGKAVWLCTLCQENASKADYKNEIADDIFKAKSSQGDGWMQVEPAESDEESGQSDDSEDDNDSYPDVVIEVPSSPVKFEAEEEARLNSQHAQECFQVIREIEKRFPANLDDYESSFSDKASYQEEPCQSTFGSAASQPIAFPTDSPAFTESASLPLEPSLSGSAVGAPSSPAEQPKRQLSIGEEIFGQLPDTPSVEDSADYEQAMRYYSAQPFYGHRPGPVYTIVEENEESAETADGRPKVNHVAAAPPSAEARSQKMSAEDTTKLSLQAAPPMQKKPLETARSREDAPRADAEMTQTIAVQGQAQRNGGSPKPIRAAPPPPFSQGLTNVRDTEKAVPKSAAADVFNAQTSAQKVSDLPNAGIQRFDSSYCTCGHLSRSAEERHDIDSELPWASEGASHASATKSTYLTSFGRLSAEGYAGGPDRVDMTSSQQSGDWWTDEAASSIDGGSDKSSAGIDERLSHVWQKTTSAYFKDASVLSEHPERGVFVSRLKRSPAMILSGIKDESDSSSAEVAPSISSSADAFRAPFSKGISSTSQSDSWSNVKKHLNDQLSSPQSSSGDMGRRKLPSVPPTFGRCQFVPADQPQTSWQYNKQLVATVGGSKGPSARRYSELTDRSQPTLGTVGKRALPPTLARVLLKQELKEALLKRMERLEASEIEANQREFVVTVGSVRSFSNGDESINYERLEERAIPVYDRFRPDSRAEKTESERHKEILNRIVEIERMTKQACQRMDMSVGTSDQLKEATRINSTTQTYSQSLLKDAQTQTLLDTSSNGEEKMTQMEPLLVGAGGQWKSVAVGTSDAKAYKMAATDTQGLEPASERLPENLSFNGSRKFRDLHSKAFALFSAEDDSASREYRKSRIRREIARRRENFNSCEDLTFSMREPYFEEMALRRQSLLGPYRSAGPCTSSLPRYSSLPRIDLLYDGPSRNQSYFDPMAERSYLNPYSGLGQRPSRKFEGYPQGSEYMLGNGRGGSLASDPLRRSYLSQSLPYLDSIHGIGAAREIPDYSRSWRDDFVDSAPPSGRSLLSHYANYLNNDFLSRPSAVNDYYRPVDSPTDHSFPQPYLTKPTADQHPGDLYPTGQMPPASLSTVASTVQGHLPSRYDRYIEPIESVPPSALCPPSDFDRKLPWYTPAPSLFDPELMEAEFNPGVSRSFVGPLAEPYFRQGRVALRPAYSDFPGEFEGRYGYKSSRSLVDHPVQPSTFSDFKNVDVKVPTLGRMREEGQRKQSVSVGVAHMPY